jgi:hypothetical protein
LSSVWQNQGDGIDAPLMLDCRAIGLEVRVDFGEGKVLASGKHTEIS